MSNNDKIKTEALPVTGTDDNPFVEFKGKLKIKMKELDEQLKKRYGKNYGFFHRALTENNEGKKTFIRIAVSDSTGSKAIENIELVLEGRKSITGRVVDRYNFNKAIKDAHVWVMQSETPEGTPEDYKEDGKLIHVLSKENGEFTITGHFRYNVTVWAELAGVKGKHTQINNQQPINFTEKEEASSIWVPLEIRPQKHDIATEVPRHFLFNLDDNLNSITEIRGEIKDHTPEILKAIKYDIGIHIDRLNNSRKLVAQEIKRNEQERWGSMKHGLRKQNLYRDVLKERRVINVFGTEIVTSDMQNGIFYGERSPEITNKDAAKAGLYGLSIRDKGEVVLGPLSRLILPGPNSIRVFTQALPINSSLGVIEKNTFVVSGFGQRKFIGMMTQHNAKAFKKAADIAKEKQVVIKEYIDEVKGFELKLNSLWEAELSHRPEFVEQLKTLLIKMKNCFETIRTYIENENLLLKLASLEQGFEKLSDIGNEKIFTNKRVGKIISELEEIFKFNALGAAKTWDDQQETVVEAFHDFYKSINDELIEKMRLEILNLRATAGLQYNIFLRDMKEYNGLFEEETKRIEKESQRLAA
jgi:hypothetical protein